MPIERLTNRDRFQAGSSFPRLGIIRPGDKQKNKNGAEYPVNLDYWRVTLESQYAHIEPVFRELYGEKPREFAPVKVRGATTDEAFPTWMLAYNTAQTQLRRCDGQHIHRQLNDKTGHFVEYDEDKRPDCICPALQAEYERQTAGMTDEQKKQVKKPLLCQKRGRLLLIFPQLNSITGLYGFFQVNTGSGENIKTIWECLMDTEQLLGTLLNVPFVFGRGEPVDKNRPDGKGGRIKKKESMFYMHYWQPFAEQVVIPMLNDIYRPAALPAPTWGTPLPTQRQLPTGLYIAVETVAIDWQEGDEFYTYVFDLGQDQEAVYTGDASAFATAGIASPERWEPGEHVTFEPPLQVRVQDVAGVLTVVGVQKYEGLATVEMPDTPF